MFTMFTTFTNLGGSTRESGACRVTDLDKISCPPSAALSTNGFVAAGSPRPNPAITSHTPPKTLNREFPHRNRHASRLDISRARAVAESPANNKGIEKQ